MFKIEFKHCLPKAFYPVLIDWSLLQRPRTLRLLLWLFQHSGGAGKGEKLGVIEARCAQHRHVLSSCGLTANRWINIDPLVLRLIQTMTLDAASPSFTTWVLWMLTTQSLTEPLMLSCLSLSYQPCILISKKALSPRPAFMSLITFF